jgi:hypothetical protein
MQSMIGKRVRMVYSNNTALYQDEGTIEEVANHLVYLKDVAQIGTNQKAKRLKDRIVNTLNPNFLRFDVLK